MGLYSDITTSPRTARTRARLHAPFERRSVQPNQVINVLGPKVTVQYKFGPDETYVLDAVHRLRSVPAEFVGRSRRSEERRGIT
jgi:hypothetical protein